MVATSFDAVEFVRKLTAATTNTPELSDLEAIPSVSPQILERVLERIDAGYREGLFEMDCDAYAGLLMCLAPDDYQIPPLPPEPTETPPGSGGFTTHISERVKVYMDRCRKGLALYHPQDAKGDAHKRGIKPIEMGGRAPGRSDGGERFFKTGGWQEETHEGNPTKEAITDNARRRFRKKNNRTKRRKRTPPG